MAEDTPLKRSPSLPMMVRYALGTTVGAGIDALVGELASMTGYLAPASFRVASLMALLITICFAELSARFPRAPGAALYVQDGFSSTAPAVPGRPCGWLQAAGKRRQRSPGRPNNRLDSPTDKGRIPLYTARKL